MAHKWGDGVHHPYRHGFSQRRSPTLWSAGHNQEWPTCAKNGFITPAVPAAPNAIEQGKKSEVAHMCTHLLHCPCHPRVPRASKRQKKITSGRHVGRLATLTLPSGVPNDSKKGTKSQVARMWVDCLHQARRIRGPKCFRLREQNHRWPTCGTTGYNTPTVWGVPNAPERGIKSEVAHKRPDWLGKPGCIKGHHRCRAADKIRNGPHVGGFATSPCHLGTH